MKVLITTGGTGGHLYPGIALAREFERQARDAQILFVGTSHGLEGRVLQREKLSFRPIRVEGILGRGGGKILKALLLLPLSFVDTYRILREFRPNLIIGIGGYASGPMMLVAGFFGIRRVMLEPNAFPGWTNRILVFLRRVDLVILAFEESRAFFRQVKHVVLIGNPVRSELLLQEGIKHHSYPTLLILGGSQGAHSINMAVIQALEELKRSKPDVHFIHQTGERDFDVVRKAYEEKGINARVEPYLFDMAQIYREADLVLARAGATTVAEITACGKPAILVPFPHATHQHQLKNALALTRAGSAVLIQDHDLKGSVIAENVSSLLGDRERLRVMAERSRALGKPQAAQEIVKCCLELIKVGEMR